MKKYNIQKNNKKLVASILSASVLFSMLAGCSNIDKYIRTNNSNSTGASTYTTESIINSSLNSNIDSTSSSAENTGITQNIDITDTSSIDTIPTTEITEPYSDINWSADSEEAFYTYMLNTYNIKLNYYIYSFGLDDYLNQYFTEYINLTRGTNYEHVPWEVTETYFSYMLHHHTINEELNGDINEAYSFCEGTFEIPFNFPGKNPWVDFETLSVLYYNDIIFGNKIEKNVYDNLYNNCQDYFTSRGTQYNNLMNYNHNFSQNNWFMGEFNPDINMFDQSTIDLYNEAFNYACSQYGYEVHPTVGEPITKELLLAMFPDRAEEIEELAAQKEAEQANEESQVETAETTRSH